MEACLRYQPFLHEHETCPNQGRVSLCRDWRPRAREAKKHITSFSAAEDFWVSSTTFAPGGHLLIYSTTFALSMYRDLFHLALHLFLPSFFPFPSPESFLKQFAFFTHLSVLDRAWKKFRQERTFGVEHVAFPALH